MKAAAAVFGGGGGGDQLRAVVNCEHLTVGNSNIQLFDKVVPELSTPVISSGLDNERAPLRGAENELRRNEDGVFELAGEVFTDRELIRRRAWDIYDNAVIGEPLMSKDFNFMKALLRHHPSAAEKFGVGIKNFTVKLHPENGKRYFCVVRRDNTNTDFSFHNCIDPRRRRHPLFDLMRAARACIMLIESTARQQYYFNLRSGRAAGFSKKILFEVGKKIYLSGLEKTEYLKLVRSEVKVLMPEGDNKNETNQVNKVESIFDRATTICIG